MNNNVKMEIILSFCVLHLFENTYINKRIYTD